MLMSQPTNAMRLVNESDDAIDDAVIDAAIAMEEANDAGKGGKKGKKTGAKGKNTYLFYSSHFCLF